MSDAIDAIVVYDIEKEREHSRYALFWGHGATYVPRQSFIKLNLLCGDFRLELHLVLQLRVHIHDCLK